MVEYATIKFSDAYGLADYVWLALYESPSDTLEDLFEAYFHPCCEEKAYELFGQPRRWTLLHHFISTLYQENFIEGFEHHRNDMLDLVVAEYRTILGYYEIPYPDFDIPEEHLTDYEQRMGEIIAHLRSLLPVSRITHGAFQVLFGDRALLLRFNQEVAKVVRQIKQKDFPEILEGDGRLRRVHVPEWAKRGIFHRDKGRCVECGRDLTGTVVTGEEAHYDHIVPLAESGTNDPTNFQLLCRGCNLSKARRSVTSERYPVYWGLDLERTT